MPRAKSFRTDNALQALLVIGLLIGEADARSAFHLLFDGFFTALAETEKERVLLDKSALDIKSFDPVDESFDPAQRRVPDFPGRFGPVAADN
jgi:hypothetical protein